MPRISVITPTFDRPEMLPRAIRSVLAQTYTDFEMIIVDDCPEKPSEGLVSSFNDSRLRYIKHEKNMGGAAARNTGMKAATGDYFCFIDDDDEWLPDILEVEHRAILDTPEDVGFVFAAVENVHTDGTISRTTVPEGIMDCHERALTRFAGFIGQTLMIKRAVYEDVGGWDAEFPSHQEIEWIIRITHTYKGLGMNRPVVRIFLGNSHSRIGNNMLKRIKGRELLLERYRKEFILRPAVYAKHLFVLSTWYRALGRYRNARAVMRQALNVHWTARYFFHYLSLCLNGLPYRTLSALGVLGDKNFIHKPQ